MYICRYSVSRCSSSGGGEYQQQCASLTDVSLISDSDTAPPIPPATTDVCPLGVTLTTQTTVSNPVYSLLTNQTASVVSQVTSLGRSVITNSMSLLSLTPQLSQDSASVITADQETTTSVSPLSMTKSSSEPPSDGSRVNTSTRQRRMSEGGDTGHVSALVTSGHSGAEQWPV